MSTPRESRSETASLLARRTEVTLNEWVQILRTWGPRTGRDEQLRWLQSEYGLAQSQALAIMEQSRQRTPVSSPGSSSLRASVPAG